MDQLYQRKMRSNKLSICSQFAYTIRFQRMQKLRSVWLNYNIHFFCLFVFLISCWLFCLHYHIRSCFSMSDLSTDCKHRLTKIINILQYRFLFLLLWLFCQHMIVWMHRKTSRNAKAASHLLAPEYCLSIIGLSLADFGNKTASIHR